MFLLLLGRDELGSFLEKVLRLREFFPELLGVAFEFLLLGLDDRGASFFSGGFGWHGLLGWEAAEDDDEGDEPENDQGQ